MSVSYGGDSIVFADGSVNSSGFIGHRNRIINGAMVIDQRNAGAAVTTSGTFPVDRFVINQNNDGAFSAQQVSEAPSGFSYSTKITTTTADASLATTQNLTYITRIEGFNTADFAFGTAAAATVTLSFWVRSSLTGTFGGSLLNSAQDRSYPFSYTINLANTWEYKTVTIPGDTTGTWLTTNGIGIRLNFGLGAGPDRSGTAGAWNSNLNLSVTGAVSVIGTLNATWQITGVQLERGSTASSFEYRSYGTELALCQRYYVHYSSATNAVSYFATGFGYTTGASISVFQFPVPMRTGPSLSTSGTASHYRWLNGGTFLTCSAVPSLDQTNPFTSDVIFTQSTTTVGFGGMIGANSTTAAYLGFSAEL
jgi:hypothetical protein